MSRGSMRRGGATLVSVALATSAVLVASVAPAAAQPCTHIISVDGPFASTVQAGDVVCGGPGVDQVPAMTGGAFYGKGGHDEVTGTMSGGLFVGGGGKDGVATMEGTAEFKGGRGYDGVVTMSGGIFRGGNGGDAVSSLYSGDFRAGRGNDVVGFQHGGRFFGNKNVDTVGWIHDGLFNGGTGVDTATLACAVATLKNVENSTLLC
jgi:hypothetical protein